MRLGVYCIRVFFVGLISGVGLWIFGIFFIALLQVNGLVLSKIITIDFGSSTGWDPVIAFGTLASAMAASLAAVIALFIENRNRAERTMRESALAQAKRATAAIALSELCFYFSKCAQEYEKFFPLLAEADADNGNVRIDKKAYFDSRFEQVGIPYNAIKVLELTLERFPEHLKSVAEAVSVVQVTNSRMIGLRRDVEIVNGGIGFNLYSQISELADAYNRISDLFDWARFRESELRERSGIPSFHGMRLHPSNEDRLVAWRNRSNSPDKS